MTRRKWKRETKGRVEQIRMEQQDKKRRERGGVEEHGGAWVRLMRLKLEG